MPNSYSNEAARAAGHDIDEDVPAWAYERIAALERLARDLYRFGRRHAAAAMSEQLTARAVDLLDLDPPDFDPATEG